MIGTGLIFAGAAAVLLAMFGTGSSAPKNRNLYLTIGAVAVVAGLIITAL